MLSDEKNKSLLLIVDDTPTNLHVLGSALQGEYRVKIATNGATALELAAHPESRPDLILLDVMMPGMDGYEVCRRLKENPATMNIPIIFVTAKNEIVNEEQGLKLGAVDYIVKPFHLAIVLARVRNHINLKIRTDLLESLAMLDGLTGIPNRRRFDLTLEDEWRRACRDQHAVSILMADIDYFKLYNDCYGHAAGDFCLKTVAQTLQSCLARAGDLIARYGGEEFVAILPGVNTEGARLIAEAWCASVESLSLPHEQSLTAPIVTLSVGYATCIPREGMLPAQLQEQADRSLYCAKHEGRNRVCSSPE
jgi:diguanylate cyclase (GGDEF)-like protein